jgi:plastocyanin
VNVKISLERKIKMNRLSISKKYFNLFFSAIFILLFGIFVSCSEDDEVTGNGGNPGQNEIWMQSNTFNPATKTISAGTTITWTNKESATHTVTSGLSGNPTGIFASTDLGVNGTFSFTFNTPGTIEYFCIHHAGMRGTIIVQ